VPWHKRNPDQVRALRNAVFDTLVAITSVVLSHLVILSLRLHLDLPFDIRDSAQSIASRFPKKASHFREAANTAPIDSKVPNDVL
jgi:hypothetical protein